MQGTWIHRRVAIHLAQWCNAKFAVRVSGWVEELLTTGRVILPEVAPKIGAWFARITPAFEDHKRYIVQCCPAGAFSILTATLGDMLLTEDELLRHSLPIKHHDLPDGSIGKQYRAYREDKEWDGLSAIRFNLHLHSCG